MTRERSQTGQALAGIHGDAAAGSTPDWPIAVRTPLVIADREGLPAHATPPGTPHVPSRFARQRGPVDVVWRLRSLRLSNVPSSGLLVEESLDESG
jgi:hypothetical protein